MSNIIIKLNKEFNVKLPSLPNYIREDAEDGACWDVADLTNSELESIGQLWTRHLIAYAQERRKIPRPKAAKS